MGVNFCCNKNISIDNSKNSLQINQPLTNLQNNEKNQTSSNSNVAQNKKIISFSPNITDKSHQITGSDDINLSLNNLNKNSSTFYKTKTLSSTKKLKNNNSINDNNHKIRNKIKSKSLGRRSVYLTRTYINILILGDKNTGKTSYINLLQKKQFYDEYKPSNDDEIHVEKIFVNKRKFNLNIMIINNIKENEDFHSNKDYYLFFYDINNVNSLNFIINLYNNFFYEKLIKINEHFSNIIFIGNKIDLKQNDDVLNTVKNFCKEKHINHYEISIKENKGIEELDKLLVNNFDSKFSEN
jgi:GTPase SAR1 family protein